MQVSKIMPKVMTSIATAQVLVALAALPSDALAQRRGNHKPPTPPAPSYPQPSDSAIASIKAYVDQGSQINLMKALKLKQKLNKGKQLEQLIVDASANAQNAKLILKLNGVKVAQAPLSHLSKAVVMDIPPGVMPQDKLTLTSNKSVYIESAEALMSGGLGQGPMGQSNAIKAQIHEQVYGSKTIPVKAILVQQSGVVLNGIKVEKVILKAQSSSYWGAKAQLIINGSPVGMPKTIDSEMKKIVLKPSTWSQNVIGQDIQSIQVQISGNALVKMVGIKMDDDLTGPGYGSRVTVRVNRTFHTSQRVSLQSLVGHMPQIQTISKLKIKASGKGKIMVTGNGGVLGSINVDSYSSSISALPTALGTDVNDVQMRVIGNVTIEEVTLKK